MEKTAKKYLTLAILSISFLQTMTTSAISPTLGRMAGEFVGTAMSTIQLAMTISSICTIVMSLTIGKLLSRFSVRSLMIVGVTLYLIGGVGGYFTGASFYQLLAMRVVLGIGLGIFSPLLPIAVSQQYDGIPRSKMMGYVQSANFLGGIAGTVLAGFIAESGWRNVHLLYIISALSLLFTMLFYPKAEKRAISEPGAPAHSKGKLPLLSFGLGLCMMMHALVFFKAPLSLAMFFPSIGLDNTSFAGNASGFLYALSFLSGIVFVPVTKMLKRMVFPTTFLLMAIAYFLLNQATSAAMVYLATSLLGVGAGIFIPSLFNKVPQVIPGPHIAQTMVIVNCGLFVGIFLSPYFSVFVKTLGENSYRFDYLVGAVMELAYMVIALIVMYAPKRGEKALA